MRASIYISEDLVNSESISFLGNFQPGTYNMILKWTLPVTRHILFAAGYDGLRDGTVYGHGIVVNCGLHHKIFTLMYGFSQICLINSDWMPRLGTHELSLSISLRKNDDADPRFFGRDMEKW